MIKSAVYLLDSNSWELTSPDVFPYSFFFYFYNVCALSTIQISKIFSYFKLNINDYELCYLTTLL